MNEPLGYELDTCIFFDKDTYHSRTPTGNRALRVYQTTSGVVDVEFIDTVVELERGGDANETDVVRVAD